MDRRIEKTKKAIKDAFYELISEYDYSKISIQDIIDKANIGRSTFYDHFETKDDLLKTMCTDLFDHIFNHDIKEEKHCFMESSTLKEKIIHIMFHLLERKDAIKGILKSDASNMFIEYFKKYIDKISLDLKSNYNNVPNEFIKHYVTSSIIEMIKYWVNNNFKEKPEVLVDYYLKMLPNDLLINKR